MKKIILLSLLSIVLYAETGVITLQLQWLHQFQFAGFYVAKEKGFYQAAGLDVTIKEFDHSVQLVDDVISNKVQFAVGRSSLLIDKNQGKEVIALAALFQSSPSVLIVTDPSIKKVSDLLDKRIMITAGEANAASTMTMLLSNNVGKNDFTIQQHSFNLQDLINHKTDAMSCYLSNEPYYLDQQHIPYKIFDPKDYGFDFYGDILFTSQNEIRNHPERTQAFYEASMKGWLWAFDHIEETAKLIQEKYNTQNKSLESLIYEGRSLKKLALKENIPFGLIQRKKFEDIAKVYQLSGLLSKEYTLDDFIDPLGFNKKHNKIGILAKRGEKATILRWQPLQEYLNSAFDAHDFKIVPLDFEELEQHIKEGSIDFVLTNSMYYVQLENLYGISRIATLESTGKLPDVPLTQYGSVIFTTIRHQDINTLTDLIGRDIGAVSPLSFGGWVMAHEVLHENDIDDENLHVKYFDTHDNVVNAVIEGRVQAGTVRTDTLEYMAKEGLLDLKTIKIINEKHYDDFPYLVSTHLYPEWPFAKLKHTSDKLANKVLFHLLAIKANSQVARQTKTAGWTIPVDYSNIHNLLKQLRLRPYDTHQFDLSDVLKKYLLWIALTALLMLLLVLRYFYVKRINSHLQVFNQQLETQVKERTHEIVEANTRLKKLAQTDSLTGISNRGHFMETGVLYFNLAKRNQTPLQLLSLDLDNFKRINDTYGHHAGDEVLKHFTQSVTHLLRESDLFGRIGGEEFVICLQNTSLEGAIAFAQRVREHVEQSPLQYSEVQSIAFTVSIGIAQLNGEKTFQNLLQKSDKALYNAKESGRNCVKVYENKSL